MHSPGGVVIAGAALPAGVSDGAARRRRLRVAAGDAPRA
jgi:hypothetical protein